MTRLARSLSLALAVVAAACGGSTKKTSAPSRSAVTLTPAQIAEQATPSIVLIKTPRSLGTGFIVWKDGRIATNLHVVAAAKEVTVVLADGREFERVQVLAADARRDLVLLKIDAGKDLPVLPLGDSDRVKPGERVVAIGHPLGLGNTVSDGLVSAIRQLDEAVKLLQVTAPIAPGSSGGPLLNEHGEVIGVATLFSTEGQNLNFGVPVSYLKPMLLSEQRVSLADLHRELQLTMLAGCPGEEVKLAATSILDAIKIGAPIYNKGDHQACFAVYEKTALDLVSKIKGCPGVRDTLLGGLSKANRAEAPTDKAWAMRHAFDRVIEAVEAAVQTQRGQQP